MSSFGVDAGRAIMTAKHRLLKNLMLDNTFLSKIALAYRTFKTTYTVCKRARTGVARQQMMHDVNMIKQ